MAAVNYMITAAIFDLVLTAHHGVRGPSDIFHENDPAGSRVSGHDPRHVSCEDLTSDEATRSFSADDLDDFSEMTLDVSRQQLIVGAKNHLLRLGTDELTLLERVEYSPDNHTRISCIAKGQAKADCHNYIRVLVLHHDQLFVCGTNAFAPQCSWRKIDSLSNVTSWIPGVAKCPFNPRHNTTYIMTSDDNFYSATWTDFTARDPAIYRMMGPSKYLRTAQYNSRWLNEPNFVSSYEIGDYVYFFFRETAVEYINCGKSDMGGKFLLEDNWTTFMKARLNCSIPGSYPFYFSELQSTYWVEEEQTFYATFSTSSTGFYGSAVCAYNLSSIEQVFTGPFKYQSDPQMAWNRVPNNSPNMQCGGAAGSRQRSAGVGGLGGEADMNQVQTQRLLVDAQKFQMMDAAVQPTRIEPFLVAERERFTHIVVDRLKLLPASRRSATDASSPTLNVIFLTTLEGSVRKMIVLPGTSTTCLVEEIHLACVSENRKSTILSIRLDRIRRLLYVGTSTKVYRLALHRCSRFIHKLQCLGAQDPYCGWSDTLHRCSPIGHPNLTSCPLLTQPVDGSWCPWSSWQPCHQTGTPQQDVGLCTCRTRSCDCPRAIHGGKPCHGQQVEVTNCTDQLFAMVDGHWSNWSDWSTCDSRCGGGHQVRSRVCESARLVNGEGRGCLGNDREWRTCNQVQCDEIRKLSDWSPWLRVNVTSSRDHNGGQSRDGYVSERFRCVCKASVQDSTHMRAPQIKTMMKHCSADMDDCDTGSLSVPDVDGSWSPWSQWTDCDSLCGGGSQYRERLCHSPPPSGAGRDCSGHSRELRACNSHSCQGQWSCWNDYSECSGPCGGQGRRWRRRECEAERPGEFYTLPCRGGDLQEISCITAPCTNSQAADWGEWSSWSRCSYDNVRQRKRNCTTTSAAASAASTSAAAAAVVSTSVALHAVSGLRCYGPERESQACEYTKIDLLDLNSVGSSSATSDSDSGDQQPQTDISPVRYYHVIIVGVICFLLGGIVVFVSLLHCQRFIFTSKDGGGITSGPSSVVMPTIEKPDPTMDFAFYPPPIHPSYGGSGCVGRGAVGEDCGRTVGTGRSSQLTLMDFRQYYHRPTT